MRSGSDSSGCGAGRDGRSSRQPPTVQVPVVCVSERLVSPLQRSSATARSWYWWPGGTLMLNVQPACDQVYSAEPADCQGDVAAPPSGAHPEGDSHWAVKRTDRSEL